MLNSSKIMFMLTMIMSIIMMISSENWLSVWMSLEINMISFIPLMKNKMDKSSEAMMSYFLIQSTSSIMFIMCILITPEIMMINLNSQMTTMIMMMSMIMKLGMAPLNMWIIQVIEKLSWESCILILTVQKINPLWVMSMIKSSEMMILISLAGCLIGSIGGLNQTSMKKIMTFSSINHMGWMIFSMKNSSETWIKYLFIYIVMNIMIMSTLKKNSIMYINQISINMKSNTEKMNIILMMLSIGGMPPTIGFLNKWMIIQENSSNQMIMLMIMMTSMINLYFYLRMISPILMKYYYKNKWNFKLKKTYSMNSIMINIITPMLMMIMI